jgi:hypothetical protein
LGHSRLDLGIVEWHRSALDDHVGLTQIVGPMANDNLRTELAKALDAGPFG